MDTEQREPAAFDRLTFGERVRKCREAQGMVESGYND